MTVLNYASTDGAAWLTLSDADRGNALTAPLVQALHEGVQQAKRDDARVVVLRARGPFFCVGGDLNAFAAAEDPGAYLEDLAEGLHRVISDLQRMDAVVVASVQGAAAGGGVSLAAAADVVLAAESARFTLAYTRIGFTPDGGGTLLVNSLGLHRALYLALLNPAVTSQEAQAMGLVGQVHADDGLEAATVKAVRSLLAGSRTAQVATKRLLRDLAQPLVEGALRRESLSVSAAAGSPDGVEGVAAFLARRRPIFPSAT